ncbi:NUMOD3 domain-containing DNA-binding protein, partial [Brevibacillus brevis]|uniref:NUMOD3 domain-containing DNA-binding protein n=1 Tax=Brevibacillus brevis TaxID=1393 RepID=UPI001C12B9F7
MPLGHRHSEETKRKISAAHKGKPKEYLKGIPRTQEVKDKISAKLKGRVIGERNDEWRKRISETMKGHKYWGKGKGYKITGNGLENIRRGIKNRYSEE